MSVFALYIVTLFYWIFCADSNIQGLAYFVIQLKFFNEGKANQDTF